MQLENREPDETVNYTIEHPLKEFAWLVGGVFGLIIVVTLVLGWFAGHVAAWLPFRHEASLADGFTRELRAPNVSPQHSAIERELNDIARRLGAVMELPADMSITVHYADDKTVNAFATLGGHIIMHRGLLERVPDENTLAMVMAHEIAHIKLRHPARAMGRGVAVGIMLTTVSANMGRSAASGTVTAGSITLLSFSREQELAADREAQAALQKLYGHVGGAPDLFRVLTEASGGGKLHVAALTTHPLTPDRVEALGDQMRERAWLADGPRAPLSKTLASLGSPRP
ncbi:MAG: M48 family metallopeptidase [Burkholderiales bacterium]|nr:M48 family metallopeptidase [Burkholderiales bacterium]